MTLIKVLAVAGLVIPAMGLAYEHVAATLDRRSHRKSGRLVEVGTTKLHAAVSGRRAAGEPAIILDGGLRTTSLAWPLVEPLLSERYQVVRFDRAGHMGSAMGQMPRDAARNVEELAELLRVLGVAPPYVYVAHSYSGFLARIFADRHAADMAGLVLADTITLPLAKTLFGERQRWSARQRQLWFSRLGITRIQRCIAGAPELPGGDLGRIISDFFRLSGSAKDVATIQSEIDCFVDNGSAAEALPDYGDLPVAVIASPRMFPELPLPEEMSIEQANDWNVQTQRELTGLSTRNVFWLARGGHEIPWEEPEIIARAVDWVVGARRDQAAGDNTRASDGR